MLPEFLRNRKIFILGAIASTIVLALGLSYAFFSRESLLGETSNNTININTISSGSISQSFTATYDNASNEIMTGILNLDTISYRKLSKFYVENEYPDSLDISINWAFVTSTLIQSDSSYNLYECSQSNYENATISNISTNCTLISPSTGNYLPNTGESSKLQSTNEISISANTTKYYAVLVTIGVSNNTRSFQGIIKVKDRLTHVLTLDLNGGTINTAISMDLKNGDSVTIPNPTKTGYTFGSWNLTVGLDSTLVSSTFTMGTTDSTLQAIWVANTYTVTYNCNGGTGGSTANSIHTYDVSKSLTTNGCYKLTAGSGGMVYYLKGWATTSTATTPNYTNGQSILNLTSIGNDTINLYAVWSALFSYSTSYLVLDDYANTGIAGDWRIKLLTNGIFTSLANNSIDVFLVGGGGGGANSGSKASSSEGIGGGGGGGYTNTTSVFSLSGNTDYAVVVGAGGSNGNPGLNGGSSSFGNLSVQGGEGGCRKTNNCGGDGGSGGSSYYGAGGSNGSNGANFTTTRGIGQGTTTCEFGQGLLGSGCNTGVTLYAGGGSAGTWNASALAGGLGGGGSGGASNASGSAGTVNTGGGGGGGGGNDGGNPSGAAGGSGIVIIRNAR